MRTHSCSSTYFALDRKLIEVVKGAMGGGLESPKAIADRVGTHWARASQVLVAMAETGELEREYRNGKALYRRGRRERE